MDEGREENNNLHDGGNQLFANQAQQSSPKWRAGFSEEIKNFRLAVTGRLIESDGTEIEIFPGGLVCNKHFAQIVPQLYLATSKAVVLSQLHEEKAEQYVIHMINSLESWAIGNLKECEKCNIHGDHLTMMMVVDPIEAVIYGRYYSGVGGFESRIHTQMYAGQENFNMSPQPQKSGWLGGLFTKRGGG